MTPLHVRYHPWLHRWAVLTAVAVVPLLLSGGTVTSMRVGMADPGWPSPPWYLLAIDWAETTAMNGIGFVVEHGHRAIGWAVGLLTFILAAWLWWGDGRRSARWLGLAALAGVCLQGLLGGLRVVLNEIAGTEFAMVHGVLGQMVFTLLASIALVTSRSWVAGEQIDAPDGPKFRRVTRLTAIVVFLQLLAGVWLRQIGQGPLAWALFLHLFLALAVLAHAAMLVIRVRRGQVNRTGYFGWPTGFLLALVVVQSCLGVGSWWFGGGQGAMDPAPITLHRAFFTTVHVLVGALVLMTATLTALRAARHLGTSASAANLDVAPVTPHVRIPAEAVS